MKKGDIKAIKAVNAAAGMKKVDVSELHNTGRMIGFKFYTNDIIVIPDMDDLEVVKDSFKNAAGNIVEYPLIKIAINDVVKYIPASAFRRDSQGLDEYKEQYRKISPICQKMSTGTEDFERVSILVGKTWKVKNLFPAKSRKFGVAYNPEDPKTYVDDSWPIFEEVIE